MKKIYIILGSLFFMTACSTDLDQSPSNIANSDSLTDFEGVLNAAYYYQLGTVTPMAVMGEFRSDNAVMDESPFTEFDEYDNGLTAMEDQFFGPFYTALYKSILSTNNVIENSTDETHIAEAKFLRALSYYKLVQVFGDVTVNLSATPDLNDTSILVRQPAADVYNNVIIPDLNDAMDVLETSITDGRASYYAAQALLGKAYAAMGNYASAEPHLAAVVNGASAAGISLKTNFDEIFGAANEVENSEIIFSTQIVSSIVDEYSPASDFWNWFVGDDPKADYPVDPDLVAAFDASDASGGGTDLRRAVTLSDDGLTCIKFPKDGGQGAEHDWIEIRLADIILLYAETLNENNAPASTVLPLLDDIRIRAGLDILDPTTINTKPLVKQAILDERRLELAFEGHRWFDLVRTGTVDAEMEETINPNYHLFPVPVSEILATDGVITQNTGY
ncbi:RagB/SusD family nutrient uptake outer membrane protein [Lacinutrix sp. C3R15]|uniref:RagB/SusD family nutrient uptake outer membrane protein n=1 Tax=Flavobacteriaceae TaxID=49546 RepID=UPI001C088334|nr:MULTISPECIES: RagB/SusD family nutrient uptake outer membrane protein [Flavobacteriaceae]MBU2938241.1 RagB/SusD family nutrient uptake outer membrane protein [Lacinutrix sp. C3R15]MDO6621555.1 RagB/SusD family nutrient uptake outer membrane protein [Oceanihabitans sp. 1_MG-2023]